MKKIFTWTSLSGLSADVLSKCTVATQRKAGLLGFVMAFVPAVNAFLMSLILHHVLHLHTGTAFLTFPLIVLFFYCFERIIVNGKHSRTLVGVRMVSLLTTAVIFSTLFDIQLLKQDLKDAYLLESRQQASTVQKAYQPQMDEIQSTENNLLQRIQYLRDQKIAWQGMLQEEADGTGGSRQRGVDTIYKNLERIVAEKTRLAEAEIQQIEGSIRQIEGQKRHLQAQLQKELNAIPSFESTGLLTRVRLLHHLAFTKGENTVLLFYVCFFLLFGLVESLPMVGKYSLRFTDYYAIQEHEEGLTITNHQQEAQERLQFELERLITANRARRMTLQKDAKLKDQELTLQEIRELYLQEIELLEWLEKEDKAAMEILSDELYDAFGSGAFSRAVRRYQKYMEEIRS
ncbi:MAG: DUF4407 domain-containing protein [Saprospirales bacterium]|nr:DUF4407 domain-containing protein [Saprospirales bacterium]